MRTPAPRDLSRRRWLQMVPWAAAATNGACRHREARADLIFISPAEPETLDPALASDQASGRVITSIFEGLMRWTEAGEAVPGAAAAAPAISGDGLVFTFHLRPEARWSNGDPVTAPDFRDSWERLLNPNTGADYVALLHVVKNAKPYSEGKLTDFSQVGLRALDDLTFEVTLEHPAPYFTDLCALFTLCPVHLRSLRANGKDWARPGKLIGNGAYQLNEWRINYRLRLDRSESYWDRANVRLRTVEMRTINNPVTALNYFLTGAADLTLDKDGVPTTLVDKLGRAPYFHSGPMLASCFMRFNCAKDGPLKNPKIRQAFGLVLDRRKIVERVTKMGEPPAYSLTPPGCGGGYRPPQPRALHDLPLARQLLADAGYPEGRGFPLVTYLYPSRDVDVSLAIEVQAMWENALGVRILPQKQEWKVYLDSMRKLNYDIARSPWVGDYNDPNTFLDIFTSDNGNNRTGWKNAVYDELIRTAAREADRAKRFEIFREAEDLLIQREAVISPVYHYVGVQFYWPEKLGGVQSNLVDEHPFRCMFWKS
ncbi:MAG: peptide ABC transporter substrate-binding protein [Verrucomicrobiales bacterium]